MDGVDGGWGWGGILGIGECGGGDGGGGEGGRGGAEDMFDTMYISLVRSQHPPTQ